MQYARVRSYYCSHYFYACIYAYVQKCSYICMYHTERRHILPKKSSLRGFGHLSTSVRIYYFFICYLWPTADLSKQERNNNKKRKKKKNRHVLLFICFVCTIQYNTYMHMYLYVHSWENILGADNRGLLWLTTALRNPYAKKKKKKKKKKAVSGCWGKGTGDDCWSRVLVLVLVLVQYI